MAAAGSTVIPVSSKVSLTAVVSNASPNSTCPPGKAHVPSPVDPRRNPNNTQLGWLSLRTKTPRPTPKWWSALSQCPVMRKSLTLDDGNGTLDGGASVAVVVVGAAVANFMSLERCTKQELSQRWRRSDPLLLP